MRAVRFDRYGDLDVLNVVDVERPVPGPGQVVVDVKTAGINPGEATIREGLMRDRLPATFPSGQGSDFAGIVRELGEGVTSVAVREEVIGFTNDRAAQAEQLTVDAANLTPRPAGVSWDQAGALFVAGTTAYAAVRAVAVEPGDTVVVSAAAGGVGSLAVQLAGFHGATVLGLASPHHHDWLEAHDVIPISYGADAETRIRQATDGAPPTAFIDTFGGGYVDLAISLGIAPERIDTIIDFEGAQRHGTKSDGNAAAASADILAELAAMIADGVLEIPVKIYPLDRVRDAYRELELRHTLGKIVLVP